MSDVGQELGPELYQNLRRLAAYYMKMERCGHTLQPTALVHEAFLRIYGSAMPQQVSSEQIVHTLARAMRHVLVDHARRRSAMKRSRPDIPPSLARNERYRLAESILTLDEALKELEKSRDRLVRVVELRYFAGMTEDEAAAILGVSRETVKRDWRFARAWLKAKLASVALESVGQLS